jgi:hypothetical protein
MRHTIAGLIAGAALAATMASAPAQACAVTDPCSRGGYGYYGHGASYGVRERLPDPAGPQYYYVNQGPTFTGPGNFAPVPTYQERAVTGWQSYKRPYYYGYNGGPYGNATSHYYDGAPDVQGPAIYTYRGARTHQYRRTHFRPKRVMPPKYYYAARPSLRYGHASPGYAPRNSLAHGPRVAPRYAAPRNARPGSKPHTYKF